MRNYKNIIKIIFHYLSNILINNIIILFRLEDYFKNKRGYWQNRKIDPQKSLEKHADRSPEYIDVQETLRKIHVELGRIKQYYFLKTARVLDIGCGPGLFLSDFAKNFDLTGIDLSKELINVASERLPYAQFIAGDFMKTEFYRKFHLIFSISVLQYISRFNIDRFFKKIFSLLESGGILFVVYPHALSFWDTLYPDLTYIQYSPSLIEKIVSRYFKIIEHHHIFDGRVVGKYDTKVYKNPKLSRVLKNHYLLVAQKIFS